MRPFFCRAGSKRKYSKALVSLFPEHTKYVEPFLGGGAVFWEKEPSPAEVINDLDKKLVADYRLIASAPTNPKLYPILPTKTSQDEFLSKSYRGTAPKLVEALLRRCNGYGGSYIPKGGKVSKTTTHEDKINRIGDYKARLGHATLTSESYESLLRKHDGASSFFFLDPPYEKSVGLDYVEGSDKFDFRKFADELGKVKGKFLVTINDSPNIRTLFKAFKLYPYVVKGHHAKSAIGREDRPELLITNYDLPDDWKSRMTKGVLKGGAYYCPDDCEDEMEGSGTHRENVLKKLGLPENGYSLAELAKASDVPKATLQKVYNRGIGAYKTNPESVRMKGTFEKGVKAPMSQKLSKEQWAQSRVYSFLDDNPKHDQDLRGGARGDVNVASTWNQATFKALEFLPTGGGCGMFAFAVLSDYLRAPINLEDVRNRIRAHGDGSLTNTDIDEVLQDAGVDFLHGHGWIGVPMDGAAIETVFETIRELGACALVLTASPIEKHITAVLPRRTPATAGGGGYEIWAFDCRREEPYNMTDREFPLASDEEYILEIHAIPMNPAPMPEPEAKEGTGRGGVKYKTYLEEALGELPELYKRRAEVENAIRLNPYYPPMMRVDPALLDLQLTGINQLIAGYESALKAIAENPARAVADWEDRRKGHRRPFFGKGLSGGARGEFNALEIYRRAVRVAGDLFDAGGGCAVFSLIVLQEYLNAPINIRRACRLARDNPIMGHVFRRDTYALLREGIPSLTDADIHDNDLNLLPNAVVMAAMNRVENEGIALLVGTPGHLRVVLPLRNEEGAVAAGGPRYRAILFGSENVAPREVTGATLGGVNGLVEIDQEPARIKGGAKEKNLEHQLSQMAYAPMTYIRDVRKKAKKAGYDPQMVGFANDGEHKLEIHTPDGRTIKFGRVGYGDHLIWTHLEKRGEAPKGVAEVKRRVFRKSHSAIRGDWRADKFSPNNLALSILW